MDLASCVLYLACKESIFLFNSLNEFNVMFAIVYAH